MIKTMLNFCLFVLFCFLKSMIFWGTCILNPNSFSLWFQLWSNLTTLLTSAGNCTHRHRPTDRHSHVHIIKFNTNNLRKTPTLLHILSSPESLCGIKAMNLGLAWVKGSWKSEQFSACELWLLCGERSWMTMSQGSHIRCPGYQYLHSDSEQSQTTVARK